MVASRSTRCVGWGHRRPQGQRSRARECAAGEAGSGPRAGQGDPARGVEADFLSPSRRREAIEQVRRVLPVSERRTCRVLGQHRSTQRHRAKDDADEQRLTADIIALAKDYGRYGYRRIHALLGTCRLAGQLVGGRADLAAGGSQGAEEATEASPALAG